MEQALEQDVGVKRKRKVAEGYASDSDEDAAEYRERIAKEEKEEEDGMFGSESEDAGDEAEEPSNEELKDEFFKEKDTMDDNDSGRYEGDHDRESDQEDETTQDPYYLDPESQMKPSKQMPRIEGFNLEDEEGTYDEFGNYARNDVSDGEHQDSWLQGVNDKQTIKRAAAAAAAAAPITTQSKRNKEDVLHALALELDIGETPLEALGRLNKQKKTDSEAKTSIETISECANELLTTTSNDIYEWEREKIIREYTKITGKSIQIKRKRSANGNDSDKEWEFKWTEDGEIQGPFTTQQIIEWKDYGSFGDFNVVIRAVGEGDDEFKDLNNVF